MHPTSQKQLFALLLGFASASPALQIQYDVAGPIAPFWCSHIVQVSQDFGRWGVSVAPEWIDRDYHRESWAKNDTTAVIQADGAGVWISVYSKPFASERLRGFKLGGYLRFRRFDYHYASRWNSTKFEQDINSYALGGETSWTFHPWQGLVVEPYLRVGLGYYDMDWKGYAPEYPHPSEFRYTWDPDVRTGVFTGWEF